MTSKILPQCKAVHFSRVKSPNAGNEGPRNKVFNIEMDVRSQPLSKLWFWVTN